MASLLPSGHFLRKGSRAGGNLVGKREFLAESLDPWLRDGLPGRSLRLVIGPWFIVTPTAVVTPAGILASLQFFVTLHFQGLESEVDALPPHVKPLHGIGTALKHTRSVIPISFKGHVANLTLQMVLLLLPAISPPSELGCRGLGVADEGDIVGAGGR